MLCMSHSEGHREAFPHSRSMRRFNQIFMDFHDTHKEKCVCGTQRHQKTKIVRKYISDYAMQFYFYRWVFSPLSRQSHVH